MKVITSPAGDELLTLPINWFGGTDFENVRTGEKVAVGVVAEMPDAGVKRLLAAALTMRERAEDERFGAADPETGARAFHKDRSFALEPSDFMREIRWINKALTAEDVADGTEVRLKDSGRGHSLDLPATAEETYEPQVGDRIAIGINITPKAMMNARGEVLAVNGTRVKVRLTAGDLKRVKRATGKNFAAETSIPKVCIEKDEA